MARNLFKTTPDHSKTIPKLVQDTPRPFQGLRKTIPNPIKISSKPLKKEQHFPFLVSIGSCWR
eukprot:6173479-Karenia_brevis.AAC.1